MSTPPPQSDDLAAGLLVKPVKTSPTRLQPHPKRPSLIRRLTRLVGLTALLLGAGTVVSVSLWTSAVLILRPHPPRWVAAYLPGWSQGWGEAPTQTLAEIEAELQQQQRYGGDWVDLALASEEAQLQNLQLLPVFETRSPCHHDCEAIVELRLYGLNRRTSGKIQFQLLHQLRVEGPTEEAVLDPVSRGDVGTMGSTYQLPLAALKPLYEQGLPGGWLTLTGRWRTQGSPVLYGQLLYISPQTLQIQSLLNWKSPPGRLPIWLNFDGEGLPELLVNQSYGMEPDFRLYTVSNVNAINTNTRLQEIALAPLALPPDLSEKAYRNALFLAQQELWSESLKRMTALQTQAGDQWSTVLERQLQLIQLHARFSQSQADRDWSQPSQKLLALLLDGQWKTALDIVNSSQTGYQRAVLPLLERDSSRIWPRITASLKVNANQREAQLWGGLLLMAKEDQAAALKWITQNKNAAMKTEFEAIAQKVTPTDPDPVTVTVTSPTPANNDGSAATQTTVARSPSLSGFFGIATPLANVDPGAWHPSANSDFQLAAGERWYAITLQRGYGRQQWQTPLNLPQDTSPPAIANFLPTLGFSSNGTLQLVSSASGQVAATGQIRGVKQRGNALTLLASGPATSTAGSLLAVLPNQWRAPADRAPQSLLALLEAQPAVGDRLLSALDNHLGFDPERLMTTLQLQADQATGLAPVRWVNFVDNADPEILLIITPALASDFNLTIPDQSAIYLILTTQGELLYSNLWAGPSQPLVGWIQPSAGVSALVTSAGDRVSLLTWSAQNRRFQ